MSPNRRNHFSLPELFIVVGVITVLVALLLPVLGRAREASKRAVCMSNVRQYGIAAFNFAAQNAGMFPLAYANQTWGSRSYSAFPCYMNHTATDYPGGVDEEGAPDVWRVRGTTWRQYEESGLIAEVMNCPTGSAIPYGPSRFYEPRYLVPWDGTSHPEYGCWGYDWGCLQTTSYSLVGGYSPDTPRPDAWPWGCLWVAAGKAPPAIDVQDRNPSGALLAADGVSYDGWQGQPPRPIWINHPRPDNRLISDYQNMLFADGHVEGRGEDIYVGTEGSPAPGAAFTNRDGFYWYWGASQ